MFVDVKLHTCDCPEMAQITSPAVSPKALGLFTRCLHAWLPDCPQEPPTGQK